MKHIFNRLILLAIVSAGMSSSAYGLAQLGGPTLLDSLDRGMWTFRTIGGGTTSAAVKRVCVGDGKKLAQIQHQDLDCTQFIVRSSPTALTISYICEGQGQGYTNIRKETNSLLQIDSQGVRNNSLFSFTLEARRSGSC